MAEMVCTMFDHPPISQRLSPSNAPAPMNMITICIASVTTTAAKPPRIV